MESALFTKLNSTQIAGVFSIPRFKQRFEIIVPAIDNDFHVLDATKVADTVLFLISAATGTDDDQLIDTWGNNILASTFSQVKE